MSSCGRLLAETIMMMMNNKCVIFLFLWALGFHISHLAMKPLRTLSTPICSTAEKTLRFIIKDINSNSIDLIGEVIRKGQVRHACVYDPMYECGRGVRSLQYKDRSWWYSVFSAYPDGKKAWVYVLRTFTSQSIMSDPKSSDQRLHANMYFTVWEKHCPKINHNKTGRVTWQTLCFVPN